MSYNYLMKTLFLILFSFSAFGASDISKKVELPKQDIAFMLEMDYPDRDTAYYIAYNKCGRTEPVEPQDYNEFDNYEEFRAERVSGYEAVYYHTSHGMAAYNYKCVGLK